MTWKPGIYDNSDGDDARGELARALRATTDGHPGTGRLVRRLRVSVNGIPYLVEVEELLLEETAPFQAPAGPAGSGHGSAPGCSLRPLPGAISGRPPWPGWGMACDCGA